MLRSTLQLLFGSLSLIWDGKKTVWNGKSCNIQHTWQWHGTNHSSRQKKWKNLIFNNQSNLSSKRTERVAAVFYGQTYVQQGLGGQDRIDSTYVYYDDNGVRITWTDVFRDGWNVWKMTPELLLCSLSHLSRTVLSPPFVPLSRRSTYHVSRAVWIFR